MAPAPTWMKIAVRSHLRAGCLAVAGIAVVSSAYLFPIVLRASGESSLAGAASVVLVPTAGLLLAVAVWLVFYVPLSLVAERIATTTAARMQWTALLCGVTTFAVGAALMGRSDIPVLFLTMTSVVLGLGGALYSFFRIRISDELSSGRPRA
jgi:hypothetical protein